jgi:hypothetical protein
LNLSISSLTRDHIPCQLMNIANLQRIIDSKLPRNTISFYFKGNSLNLIYPKMLAKSSKILKGGLNSKRDRKFNYFLLIFKTTRCVLVLWVQWLWINLRLSSKNLLLSWSIRFNHYIPASPTALIWCQGCLRQNQLSHESSKNSFFYLFLISKFFYFVFSKCLDM